MDISSVILLMSNLVAYPVKDGSGVHPIPCLKAKGTDILTCTKGCPLMLRPPSRRLLSPNYEFLDTHCTLMPYNESLKRENLSRAGYPWKEEI